MVNQANLLMWSELCTVLCLFILSYTEAAFTEADKFTYAYHCHNGNLLEASRSWDKDPEDRSCKCGLQDSASQNAVFTKEREQLYHTRQRIKVAIGSWLAAAVDAFLLKILIEEHLGYPTDLVSDDDRDPIWPWPALADGTQAHVCACMRMRAHARTSVHVCECRLVCMCACF